MGPKSASRTKLPKSVTTGPAFATARRSVQVPPNAATARETGTQATGSTCTRTHTHTHTHRGGPYIHAIKQLRLTSNGTPFRQAVPNCFDCFLASAITMKRFEYAATSFSCTGYVLETKPCPSHCGPHLSLASATTFDEVKITINFVCTIDRHINHRVHIQATQGQASCDTQLQTREIQGT